MSRPNHAKSKSSGVRRNRARTGRPTSTLLTAGQRAFIVADIKIDSLVLDRATEAFDALVQRGDVDEYTRLMKTAILQMGYDRPIKPQDRPTAVDVAKSILIKSYADRQKITFKDAAARLKRMIAEG